MNKKFFYLICLSFWLTALAMAHEENQLIALLKGEILIKPVATLDNPLEQMREGQIPAGGEVALSLKIKNAGNQPTPPGTLQIHYKFPSSLHHLSTVSLFETEAIPLPVLKPGEEKTVTFDRRQRMPTLYDFVRDDWGKREYQAVVKIAGQEHLLSSVALTFSAYYYEIPVFSKMLVIPVANP